MYWNGHCVSVNFGGLVMSCWIGDDFVMLYPMALSDRRHDNNLLEEKAVFVAVASLPPWTH
jgi:hypothetical protein